MDTSTKVIALIRFYSARYTLGTSDWLEALIELESNPRTGGNEVNGSTWWKYKSPPRSCEHCGHGTQYGTGAKRHHTNKHSACTAEHDFTEGKLSV